VIIFEFEREDWEALQMSAMVLSPFELLAESTQRFAGWDGYRGLLEDFLPESIDVDQFLSCPGCDPVALDGLDTEAFVEGLAEEVVEPMIATQELLGSRPYVTRLYTTLSAPEMDLDPLFDFNPDLPIVSNVHTARQVIECHRSVYIWQAPSRFHLEDGRVVRLNAGDPWPFTPGDEDAPPANALVLELTTSGPGTVVEDNSEAIDQALEEHNGTVASPSGCGCGVVAPRSSISAWAALGLFALLRWRRRRLA
jgi:MYXO-CTERM domain-containing protein